MPALVRLGLIGAGRWGRNYIRTIGALPGVRLARLASHNPASARLVPAGCEIFADWRNLLDPRAIDGIIIATPPALHARMAVAAVESGLPALVEKPLTLDLAEAISLRNLTRARNGFVTVGHTHLYSPAWRRLRQLAGDLGSLRGIRSEAGDHGPFRPDVPVLWDWGAHDVAMCMALVGAPPVRVQARVLESRPIEGSLGEIIELSLLFAQEIRAHVRIGNMMPKRRWFAAYFDVAVLVYDDLAPDKLMRYAPAAGDDLPPPAGGGTRIEVGSELPLSNVVREFSSSVRNGDRDLSELELGLRVVETLARLQSSV